jgi:hypothetical protein
LHQTTAHPGVKIISSVATPDGGSKFEESWIAFEPSSAPYAMTPSIPAKHLSFRWTPGDFDFDYHLAPRRRLVIVLEGGIEAKVSTGEVVVFKPGDVWELRDTSGVGHCSRAYRGKPFRTAFIALDENIRLDRRVALTGAIDAGMPCKTMRRTDGAGWRIEDDSLEFKFGGVEGVVTDEIPIESFKFICAYGNCRGGVAQIKPNEIEFTLSGRVLHECGQGRELELRTGEILQRNAPAGTFHERLYPCDDNKPTLSVIAARL